MDERTKAIDSAVRNFASAWQGATAAYDAGMDAGMAAERERWRIACGAIADDLRNHDMVRLGAAKCIDRALKA